MIAGSYQYILVLNDAGRAGINLSNGSGMFVAPSANLHVNGSVRLQNLPYGNGCPLVVDSSGNIYRTDCSGQAAALQSTSSKSISELENKINALESKIQNLLTEIESLTKIKQAPEFPG